jgi:OOP family OmpA-OmpF porin
VPSIRLSLTIALIASAVVLTPLGAMATPDGPRATFTADAGAIVWSEYSNIHDDVYFGGLLGFMFNRHLGVEGRLAYNPSVSRTSAREIRSRHLGIDLRYQLFPDSWMQPYLTGGWTQFRFDPEGRGGSSDDEGWEYGLGLLFPVSEGPNHRASLRLDARNAMIDFEPPRFSDGAYHHNFIFTAGVTVEFGEDWHKDTDRDGVIDRMDVCDDTARGVVVDAKGCPIDSDGDGVFDGLDQCDATPAGAVIDSLGCPMDSDGDGVLDGLDQCDATPAGAVIDGQGCPLDGDGDGVFDGLDACSSTPRGVVVDSEGCPRIDSEEERALYETGLLVLAEIEFESGKAELKPTAGPLLRPVGDAMRKWPDLKLEVGGYTDDRGAEAANQRLSQERADAVRDFLMEKYDWVTPERLTAVGYGEANPVADNATEEGRGQNRRVEFKVLEGGPQGG